MHLRDAEEDHVVPFFCVNIWETTELTEFCSSFGPESLLLHVSKRLKIPGNFDADRRMLQLMPYVSAI